MGNKQPFHISMMEVKGFLSHGYGRDHSQLLLEEPLFVDHFLKSGCRSPISSFVGGEGKKLMLSVTHQSEIFLQQRKRLYNIVMQIYYKQNQNDERMLKVKKIKLSKILKP
jgi:hypothetical protein